jgi:hypothetical protein
MPAWLLDLFASRQLNQAFLLINLGAAPFWLALLFAPASPWTRRLVSPFAAPALLSLVYLYVVYLLLTRSGLPALPAGEIKSVRSFIVHPLVFLALWAHLTAVNLFVGAVISQEAVRLRMRVPLELLLCWLFAPAALCLFACRRGIRTWLT